MVVGEEEEEEGRVGGGLSDASLCEEELVVGLMVKEEEEEEGGCGLLRPIPPTNAISCPPILTSVVNELGNAFLHQIHMPGNPVSIWYTVQVILT